MFYLALKSVGNEMKGGKSDTFSVLNIGHESVTMHSHEMIEMKE